MILRRIALTATAGCLLGSGTNSALGQTSTPQAQDTVIEHVIVTAQRREEQSIDVPITVTTLAEGELETANVLALSDISKIAPALRFDFAGGFYQPTIRGVGTAVTTSGGGGNVGIYVDGFYSPNPLVTNFELMKVQNIQVLKGPQGTLFGRNTTGGAILVQTAEPSTEEGGELKLSYGRYNRIRAQGYYTFGLTDRIAMDLEGSYGEGDGWQRNISNGEKLGAYNNWSARVGLKFELTDNVSALLRYQHNRVDDPTPLLTASYFDSEIGSGAPYFAMPGEFTFNRNEVATGTHPSDQEYFKLDADVVQATIKADLGFADLTSYSQYRREDVDSRIELDYSGVELIELGLPNKNSTVSQEFLLTSKPGSRLQWTTGLFYLQNKDTYIVYYDYFPMLGITERSDLSRFGSSTTTKSYAAFVDGTYEVTPKFFVTAGLRYAYDKIEDAYYIDQFGYPVRHYVKEENPEAYDAASRDHLTSRLILRYKPTDDTNVYASYTQGYKAALLDVGGGGGAFVKPEKIDAYEIGFKYARSIGSFEAAAFYYDYKNLQVSLYRQGQAQIVNAANSEIYGVDAQFRLQLTDRLQLNAGGAWLHARYKDFENAPVYVPCVEVLPDPFDPVNGCQIATFLIPDGNDLKDVTMQRAPEFTGNLGALYTIPVAAGHLALSGNLYYSSSFFFGPSGIQFRQGSYEVLSLRAQWTDASDRYRIALWGDNVTNSRYRTQVQFNQPGIGVNWSRPVTYGVELGVKF
jgi:iron complex outermembrane receptor protein